MKQNLRKILSAFLSLALAMSILAGIPLFNGTTASAEATTLTTADLAGTNWWSSMLATGDAEDGGVRFTFTNAFRNIRLGFNNEVTLDGLNLKIANITKNANNDPIVSFLLANSKAAEILGEGYFALTLDTEAGALKIIRNKDMTDESVILTNDALKYANITGKTVLITLSADDIGNYAVNVQIDSDVNLSAMIPSEVIAMSTAYNSNATTYLTVTPGVGQNVGKDQSFSVDVKELWAVSNVVKPIIRAINAIGTVDIANGQLIYNARTLYNALSQTDKAGVTNYALLTAAESEYQRLSQAADSSLVKMDISHARLTSAALSPSGIWGSKITISDIATGGLRYYFKGSSINIREGYTANVNLDGLKLQFDNFIDDSGNSGKAQFAVLFGNGNQYGPDYSDNSGHCLAIVLNPFDGKIQAFPSTTSGITSDSGVTVIQNNLLKSAEVQHRRFSYSFTSDGNGGLNLDVSIAGQILSGNIPSATIVLANRKLLDLNNTSVMVSSSVPINGCASTQFGVDWIGLDTGIVDGYKANIDLNSEAVTTVNSTVNTDQIYLTDKDSGVSFTADNALAAKVQLTSYNNSSTVDVYVDNVYTETVSLIGSLTKWYTLAENLDYTVPHTFKVLRSNDTSTCGIVVNGLRTENYVPNPAQEYVDMIDHLADIDLLENGQTLRNTRSTYDALSDELKANVTNYDELLAAEAEYIRLADIADAGMISMNTNHARRTMQIGTNPETADGRSIIVSDAADGGLNYQFTNALRNYREGYTSNVNMNGVKLQFDNFSYSNANKAQFAVYFGKEAENGPDYTTSGGPCLALVLDPNLGTITTYPNQYTVINNPLLRGSNLQDRRFSYQLVSAGENNGFDFIVTVGANSVKGYIPQSIISAAATGKLSDTSNTSVMVTCWDALNGANGNTFNIKWVALDTGILDGMKSNLPINQDNVTFIDSSADSGEVYLKQQNSGIEFKSITNTASVLLTGYNEAAAMDVYVDDVFVKTINIEPKYTKWYSLGEKMNIRKETSFKLVKSNAEENVSIIVNGIYSDTTVYDPGDINTDDKIDTLDLAGLRKYLLDITYNNINMYYSDVTENGSVDIKDLVRLKKNILQLSLKVNNAELLPEWYAASAATVNADNTPYWTDDLIMGEANISTATAGGTLDSAVTLLDHYAETGINGIWITPVYDRGNAGNGYGNLGIDTIDSGITGTDDYQQGWAKLAEFINKAHEKNIRIILDVTFRGVANDSPLVTAHPDWFSDDLQYTGNKTFKWQDPDVTEKIQNWYVRQIVSIANLTGCDGFRYDMMPSTATGTGVEADIINSLHVAGHYGLIISESSNTRDGNYGFEQVAMNEMLANYRSSVNYFLDNYNLTDFIKLGNTALNGAGNYKYYAYAVTSHDNKDTVVKGNRLSIGYQTVFSPFIPIIYLGEEWNNTQHVTDGDTALYYNTIDWSLIETNSEFFEDVKSMVRIRRLYPEIFANFASSFKNSNICAVSSTADTGLVTAYARYAGNKSVVVVPNNSNAAVDATVSPVLSTMGLGNYSTYVITDAENGAVIVSGSASDIASFNVSVESMDQRVLLITAE